MSFALKHIYWMPVLLGLVISAGATEQSPVLQQAVEEGRILAAGSGENRELSVKLPGNVEMKFVLIPPGEFQMGSPATEKDRDEDEGPVHTVKISKPFYMGIYEVTQEQWAAVMGKNPAEFQPHLQNPAEKISWDECLQFAEKMNALGQGKFRLPTEAEWEYACRAGTTTRFYWGDDPTGKDAMAYAWFEDNAQLSTQPVGQKKPNAWGLYDMSGNVWEWCNDWHAPYPNNEVTNPAGPEKGRVRVSRGGGWRYGAQYCRSADRYYSFALVHSYLIGVRLVRECP